MSVTWLFVKMGISPPQMDGFLWSPTFPLIQQAMVPDKTGPQNLGEHPGLVRWMFRLRLSGEVCELQLLFERRGDPLLFCCLTVSTDKGYGA